MGKKIEIPAMTPLGDLFGSGDNKDGKGLEFLSISLLDDFETGEFGHTFQVLDNEELEALSNSIRENGILNPIIVRQKPSGRYEVIAGHRRKAAAKKIGLTEVPAIIKNMSDDEAIIAMADTNLQREQLLPSEKAYSYRAKLEAMSRQGKRSDLDGEELSTSELIGESNGDSRATVLRYVRLTYLNPDLLQFVDEGKLKLGAALSISYLTAENQELVLFASMQFGFPSASQAAYIRKMEQSSSLNEDSLNDFLSLDYKEPKFRITEKDTAAWFPEEYTGDAAAKKELIAELLRNYFQNLK